LHLGPPRITLSYRIVIVLFKLLEQWEMALRAGLVIFKWVIVMLQVENLKPWKVAFS
jgi:hypothetical protein